MNRKAGVSLSHKITRFRARMHDREWRRYGRLLLAGKMMGVVCFGWKTLVVLEMERLG